MKFIIFIVISVISLSSMANNVATSQFQITMTILPPNNSCNYKRCFIDKDIILREIKESKYNINYKATLENSTIKIEF